MKWLFGIFLLSAACYLSGTRVHPENLKKYFERENHRDYLEVIFKSGSRLAGRKIRESDRTLEIQTGNGSTVFLKNEIESIRPLDPEAVRTGRYADVIIHEHSGERPLVTLRYEDSVFALLGAGIERFVSRILRQFRSDGAAWNPFNLKQMIGDAVQGAMHAGAVQESGPAAFPALGAQESGAGLTSLLGSAAGGAQEDYSSMIQGALEKLKKSGS